MPQYRAGWTHSSRGGHLTITRVPRPAAAVEAVTDLLCRVTRGRSCPRLCIPVLDWVERRRDTFELPVTDEQLVAFCRWRGWGDAPYFVDEDV